MNRASRRRLLGCGLALILAAAAVGCGESSNDSKTPAAVGTPFKGPTSELAPFDPNAPSGAKPSGLDARMAFGNQSDAQFFLDLQAGLKKAADEGDLDFISANADGDTAKNIEQLNSFRQRGVGALITVPVGGEEAQAQIRRDALKDGAFVGSFLSGPATTVFAADQCQIGTKQGEDAAQYINETMGGEANVVYFNADRLSPVLVPRHECAIKAVKAGGGGIEVVADEYNEPSVEGGAKLMATILQAHPDVNVIIGDDDSVVGALQAVRSAGKIDQIKYASGVNGSAAALDLAASGTSPFKVSYAFNYGVLGYHVGKFASDYLAGKSVPQVIIVKSVGLRTKEDIERFNEATKSPENVADPGEYVQFLGNISYETRGDYVDYAP